VRLSYSAISTYQKCPLSYKFQYVDRLPTKPSHYLSFGNSIHAALEFFYGIDTPQPHSLERLLEELDNVWISDGYENEAHEKEYKEKGRAILTTFYHENLPSFKLPVAVEKQFTLDIDGITLVGVIDRIDRLSNGGLEVIDYKTNEKLPPKTKLNTDLQLPIYHMATEEIYGTPPQKVTFYFLVPNQKMSARKTNPELKNAKDTILKVADNIQKEKFDPFKNPLCPWCDFIEHCPIYRDDPVMLARAASNGKIPKASNSKSEQAIGSKAEINNLKQSAAEIENVVDEYLALTRQIRQARVRLDELQNIIHNYCEKQGLTSVSGTQGGLTRMAHKTTHYNIDKLRELLEPRGLWEKVLDVNSKLLKKLLDDEESRGELRKLIEAAKEVEEISYVLYIKDEMAGD